jgi:nitrous oxidase accessory protein NosD
MERSQRIDRLFLAFCASFVVCASAVAQNTRSAVSVTGNDANVCTVPSPCRTFGKAVSVTNSGGEVIALDSGGYGRFTIDRAVTVRPVPGAYAGLAPTSGDGINVSAGPNDDVILRGITINGLGGDLGILFSAGRSLHVESCSIDHMPTGIADVSAGPLFVSDTSITNSTSTGILVGNGSVSDPVVFATISSSHLDRCGAGVSVYHNGRATITNTVFSGNSDGLEVFSLLGTLTADAVIENSIISGSSSYGIISAANNGGTAMTRVSNCTIAHNLTGVSTFSSQNAPVLSRQNNTLQANDTNGTFTGTFSAN